MQERKALELFADLNPRDLGREPGEKWWEHRYDFYYPPKTLAFPWMYGTTETVYRHSPQRGLASAIRRMTVRTSGATAGPPGPRCWLFQVQKSLNPVRCHRITVSGWTMATASAQPCHRRESRTQNSRSERRRRGRGVLRRRTVS